MLACRLLEICNCARVLIGAMEQPYATRGQWAARDPPKLCLWPVRVFEHIWVTFSHQNDSGLMNLARIVKFHKHNLTCNGNRAQCVGRCVLDTLLRDEVKKRRSVRFHHPLTLSVLCAYILITNLMHDYYWFIKYYSPLHVSSLKCSSSGGYSCILAAYGTVTLYEISWWPVGTQFGCHSSCVPTGHHELS